VPRGHGGLSHVWVSHSCLLPRRCVPAWRLWGSSWLILLCTVSWGWAHENPRLAPATMVRQRLEGRAPKLALVNQSGQPLTLTELRGKVVLLAFTSSTCAEMCPLITAAMVTLQQGFTPAERQQVFFLAVTAQPDVDIPALLHPYDHRLSVDLASWAFVIGHPQAVQAVWLAFGLTVKPLAHGGGGSSRLDVSDRPGGYGPVSLSQESPGGGDHCGGHADTLVRRGSAGTNTSTLRQRAEPSAAADALQRPLVPRPRFRARLSASIIRLWYLTDVVA
jgi:cytochrome oxidase Cu insertion factor (SCO1/SenC/PrrC family)